MASICPEVLAVTHGRFILHAANECPEALYSKAAEGVLRRRLGVLVRASAKRTDWEIVACGDR
jgi:hypothetical protein